MDAQAALARLKQGNEQFMESHRHSCDLTPDRVHELYEEGQHPFAVVLTCADSRVAPEHIFMTGLGELFVLRVAGNVLGDMELASAVYAAEHLGARLILVMGHTHCGAVAAALADSEHGCVCHITHAIQDAIGAEKDPYKATVMNVQAAMSHLAENEEIRALERDGLELAGAVYHTETGAVDFL
jgi:carbonic anhydrase